MMRCRGLLRIFASLAVGSLLIGCASYVYQASPAALQAQIRAKALALQKNQEEGARKQYEEMKKRDEQALALSQYNEEITKARSLETLGDLRTALTHYTAALAKAKEAGQADKSLRKEIIPLVRKLNPPPAISEEARRYAIRGQAILQSAKQEYDFKRAADEFERALLRAPWWGDAYYNRGLAQEASGDPSGAIQSFNLFLLAEPNFPESARLRDKIYALEVKAEEVAAKNQWVGKWRSEAGSNHLAAFVGSAFTMRQLEPSPTARQDGWQPGDVVFEGTWEGTVMKGRSAERVCAGVENPANCIQCLGEVEWFPSTLTLSPDGTTLTDTHEYTMKTWNMQTCVVRSKTIETVKSVWTKIPDT